MVAMQLSYIAVILNDFTLPVYINNVGEVSQPH